MQPAPQPDDVLVRNALTKLRLKKRIAEWDQYVEGKVPLGKARSRLGCAPCACRALSSPSPLRFSAPLLWLSLTSS